MAQHSPLLPSPLINLRMPSSTQEWIAILSKSLMNPSRHQAIFKTGGLWRHDRGARSADPCNRAVSLQWVWTACSDSPLLATIGSLTVRGYAPEYELKVGCMVRGCVSGNSLRTLCIAVWSGTMGSSPRVTSNAPRLLVKVARMLSAHHSFFSF